MVRRTRLSVRAAISGKLFRGKQSVVGRRLLAEVEPPPPPPSRPAPELRACLQIVRSCKAKVLEEDAPQRRRKSQGIE